MKIMKIIPLLSIVLVSCKTVPVNEFASGDDKQVNHKIEIIFVNSGANYSAIMHVIQQNGFSAEIQYYPIATNFQTFSVLFFRCCNVTEKSLVRFKNSLGSCNGVVSVCDSNMD